MRWTLLPLGLVLAACALFLRSYTLPPAPDRRGGTTLLLTWPNRPAFGTTALVLSVLAVLTNLVVGDDDLWLDVADVVWAGEQIPDARVTVLEGIGHYPMEELDGFAGIVDGWLTELAAHRAGANA